MDAASLACKGRPDEGGRRGWGWKWGQKAERYGRECGTYLEYVLRNVRVGDWGLK